MIRQASSGQRCAGLGLDRGERLLGHARDNARAPSPRAPPPRVAHEPGEADERADVGRGRRGGRELGAEVEVLALHPDRHSAAGHRREERHLADAGERRREVGELLVDRDPHRPQVGEGERVALLAAAKLLDELGDGRRRRSRRSRSARRPARAARRNSAPSASPLAVPQERHRLHQVVVAGQQRQEPGDPDQDQPAVRQDPPHPVVEPVADPGRVVPPVVLEDARRAAAPGSPPSAPWSSTWRGR